MKYCCVYKKRSSRITNYENVLNNKLQIVLHASRVASEMSKILLECPPRKISFPRY